MKTEAEIRGVIDDIDYAIRAGMPLPACILEMLVFTKKALEWTLGENDHLTIMVDGVRNVRVQEGAPV